MGDYKRVVYIARPVCSFDLKAMNLTGPDITTQEDRGFKVDIDEVISKIRSISDEFCNKYNERPLKVLIDPVEYLALEHAANSGAGLYEDVRYHYFEQVLPAVNGCLIDPRDVRSYLK